MKCGFWGLLRLHPNRKRWWINLGPESQNWYGFVSKSYIPHTPEVIRWVYSPKKWRHPSATPMGGPKPRTKRAAGPYGMRDDHPTMGGAWPQVLSMDWFSWENLQETHGFLLPSNCLGFPVKISPSCNSMKLSFLYTLGIITRWMEKKMFWPWYSCLLLLQVNLI